MYGRIGFIRPLPLVVTHLERSDAVKEVAGRIKSLRVEHKMTKKAVADALELSQNKYTRIENATDSPTVVQVDRISEFFQVSRGWILNDRVEIMEKKSQKEEERLLEIMKDVPADELDTNKGLIEQAARLKVLLDDNWRDILENGEYEKFSQSESQLPYDRKRPIVENYDNRDKTYQSIIHQLTSLIPKESDKKLTARERLLGK